MLFKRKLRDFSRILDNTSIIVLARAKMHEKENWEHLKRKEKIWHKEECFLKKLQKRISF